MLRHELGHRACYKLKHLFPCNCVRVSAQRDKGHTSFNRTHKFDLACNEWDHFEHVNNEWPE